MDYACQMSKTVTIDANRGERERDNVCRKPVYCEKPIGVERGFNFSRRQGIGHSNIFTTLEARLSSNGDLNLDTSVDVDNDLLDDLGGGVEAAEMMG